MCRLRQKGREKTENSSIIINDPSKHLFSDIPKLFQTPQKFLCLFGEHFCSIQTAWLQFFIPRKLMIFISFFIKYKKKIFLVFKLKAFFYFASRVINHFVKKIKIIKMLLKVSFTINIKRGISWNKNCLVGWWWCYLLAWVDFRQCFHIFTQLQTLWSYSIKDVNGAFRFCFIINQSIFFCAFLLFPGFPTAFIFVHQIFWRS